MCGTRNTPRWCRSRKPAQRRDRILFIDAVNEIAREHAYSFLRPEHQQRIANTFHAFESEAGFATVATLEQVAAQGHNLSIPLYVKRATSADGEPCDERSLAEVQHDWERDERAFWRQMDGLVETLDGLVPDATEPASNSTD